MTSALAGGGVDRDMEHVQRLTARLAQVVERTVQSFPPLTSDQRSRLAGILRAGAAVGSDAA